MPAPTTAPIQVLKAYFDALTGASNLTATQSSITGTAGFGTKPYPSAYAKWSEAWRTHHPYKEFLASWQGTAHLQLLKLLPAGRDSGEPGFFVEVKTWEVTAVRPRVGAFFYDGFFTVGKTANGWRITGGQLHPESFDFGGHQPWRSDPVSVAEVAVFHSVESAHKKAAQTNNPDGTVKVSFAASSGKVSHYAVLVYEENGWWRVIDQE